MDKTRKEIRFRDMDPPAKARRTMDPDNIDTARKNQKLLKKFFERQGIGKKVSPPLRKTASALAEQRQILTEWFG